MIDFKLFAEVASKVFSEASQVSKTSLLGLRKVAFHSGGRNFIAIEQNPNTGSKWAGLARNHEVVQFKNAQTNAYVAVAVDGRVQEY